MDYSAIADDPAVASPWGSSSPRAQRAPFAGSIPESPTTPGRQAQSESQTNLPEPALSSTEQQPDSSASNGHHAHVEQHEPAQQTQISQQSEQHQGQPGGQNQAPQQRPGAARYHSARQQRPIPQYKLQAKVTALERTGRKDPVLRFDVYV